MKDSIGLIHDLVDMVETLAMLDLRMCHMCEDIAAKKHVITGISPGATHGLNCHVARQHCMAQCK